MFEKVKNYFNDWTMFEKIWLAVFTLIEVYLFFAWHDTLIGMITMLTGIWCVVLVAKGKRLNFYPGVINAILYAYIAYQSRLYGEVMLNALYFLPMQFIGYWVWTKTIDKNDSVKARMLSSWKRIALILGTGIAVYAYGLFLQRINGNFPFTDATSTVLSVIAMILMTLRYGEQWMLWIFVNIVSIIMWVGTYRQSGEGLSMIVMWSAYLVNAFYGMYNWNKMSKKV